MNIVFLGPTLSREAAKKILPEVVCLPPVAQGDIVSLCRVRKPEAIGIVDGVFRQSLSVWHKEILFALDEGVRVLGASSMGAIRAVECEPWGAEPIGVIADWIKAERVSDADVALAHAQIEHGYRPLSVPLVNVMASLEQCEKIAPARREEILEAAKAIFYEERRWPTIAKAAKCTKEERMALTKHQRDQKAIDARAMLEAMKTPAPARELHKSHNVFKSYGRVLQENDVRLRCPGGKPRRAWEVAGENAWCADPAADRALAIQFARSLGFEENLESVGETPGDWDLLPHEFARLVAEERMLARARTWLRSLDCGLGETGRRLDYLRTTGVYPQAKAGSIAPLNKPTPNAQTF